MGRTPRPYNPNTEARQERIKAAKERLETAVTEFTTSDQYQHFLAAAATFHTYSWRNVMMILSQRPNASLVKGFQGWIELGRSVKKGEKGIVIFAPRPYKKMTTDGEGNEVEASGMTFSTATVFDISQTDPIPGHPKPFVPMSSPLLTEDSGHDLFLMLVRYTEDNAVCVQQIDDKGTHNAAGWYMEKSESGEPEIYVRPAAMLQQLKTMIHEYAHHLARTVEDRFSREAEEVVVESIAFIVCDHFGLDTSQRSVPYVANWLQGDPKAFERGMAFITTTAAQLIDVLEAVRVEEAVAA